MTMSETTPLDALETRTPAEREAALLAALPAQIAHAQAATAAFARHRRPLNEFTSLRNRHFTRTTEPVGHDLIENRVRNPFTFGCCIHVHYYPCQSDVFHNFGAFIMRT